MNLPRLLVLLIAALLSGCAALPERPVERAPLILISIDGFRPDYLDRGLTPTLSGLAAAGVRGEGMRPSFPSNTFPNHYTLVTGLRPDRHGVVNNTMEDPALPGGFSLGKREAVIDARWWNDAEPMWVTAKRQGRRTATMFWPGSEAEIRGVRPDEWKPYVYGLPAAERVDTVLGWLDRPADARPDFITLYFEAVDSMGHRHGPDAPETNQALRDTDAALARLLEGLRAKGLEGRVNLLVVSDHGMAATSNQRQVILDDFVDVSKIRIVTGGAMAGLEPAAGFDAATEQALLRPGPQHQCWRKGALPSRFRYGQHRRVPAFVCLAKSGWTLTRRADAGRAQPIGGQHGYDPIDPQMRALFVAHGPAFRRGARVRAFDNVDVYPLMARVLGVRPEPNDGDLDELRAALVR